MGSYPPCLYYPHASCAFSCPGKHWRHRSDGNEQHLRVKRVFLHPLYDPNTFENDVALVELLESAVLSDYVMPICLPQGPPQEGTLPQPEPHPCRAAGASMGMSPTPVRLWCQRGQLPASAGSLGCLPSNS